MKRRAALLLLVPALGLAQPQTPLDAYLGTTQTNLILCQLARRIAAAQAEKGDAADAQPARKKTPAETYPACIAHGRAEAKTLLDRALPTLRKPAAREALKSAHVAHIAALQGIRPAPEEIVIDYRRRQQRLADTLEEALARFETER